MKPVAGDKIEVSRDGGATWIPAFHNGNCRQPHEFWTRTEHGPGMPVRYSDEGRRWRWPVQSNPTEKALGE